MPILRIDFSSKGGELADIFRLICGKTIEIMKKKIVILTAAFLAILSLGVFTLDVYNDNRLVAKDSLPVSISDFVNTNFPGTTIRSAEIDFLSYTVWLEDDTLIEFDWNRTWEKIECYRNTSVPSQLIPGNITSHIKAKYPEGIITEVSKDDGRYDINLSGHHFELVYDKNGNYIGIDK